MFINFFYLLKENKIPVTITEWMTFIKALHNGLHDNTLMGFYELARIILIKDEANYDTFDQIFSHYFKGSELNLPDIGKEILDWLKDPKNMPQIPENLLKELENMDLDKLLEELQKRLEEQKEEHHGGTYWIGTGGASPFGHSGQYGRAGIRIGNGNIFHRMALKVATERRFKNYRADQILDVRQTKLALKKLRVLAREGREDILDIDASIEATCKNAGEIELVFHKSRKNIVKLLLLMDTGGSMDPFTNLCNRIFSAAYQSDHFKHFFYYFFHNHLSDYVYTNYYKNEKVNTNYILHQYDPEYRVIIIGDAAMAPEELYWDGWYSKSGWHWFMELKNHFRKVVWLNPVEKEYWNYTRTTMDLSHLFNMYPLTLQGLEDAITFLTSKKR